MSRDVLPLVGPLLSRRRRSWLPARRSSLPRLAKPLSAVVRHDARSPLTCLPVASPPGRAPERHLSYELLGVCVCCPCAPSSPPSSMCMLAHRRLCAWLARLLVWVTPSAKRPPRSHRLPRCSLLRRCMHVDDAPRRCLLRLSPAPAQKQSSWLAPFHGAAHCSCVMSGSTASGLRSVGTLCPYMYAVICDMSHSPYATLGRGRGEVGTHRAVGGVPHYGWSFRGWLGVWAQVAGYRT